MSYRFIWMRVIRIMNCILMRLRRFDGECSYLRGSVKSQPRAPTREGAPASDPRIGVIAGSRNASAERHDLGAAAAQLYPDVRFSTRKVFCFTLLLRSKDARQSRPP